MSLLKEELGYAMKEDYKVRLNFSLGEPYSLLHCDLVRFNRVIGKRMNLFSLKKQASRSGMVSKSGKTQLTTIRTTRKAKINDKFSNYSDIKKRKSSMNKSSQYLQVKVGLDKLMNTKDSSFQRKLSNSFQTFHKFRYMRSGKPLILSSDRNSRNFRIKSNNRTKAGHPMVFYRNQRLTLLKDTSKPLNCQVKQMILDSYSSLKDERSIQQATTIQEFNIFNYSSEDEEVNISYKCIADEPDISVINPFSSKLSLDTIITTFTSGKLTSKVRNQVNTSFLHLISTSDGLNSIVGLYNGLRESALNIQFLKLINFLSAALTIDCNFLLDFLSFIISTTEEADFIYSLFNTKKTWLALIYSKYGKNLVEYFMKEFYINSQLKHSTLFSIIDQHFEEYSFQNYTTFVVQVYVSQYARASAFKKIMKHFDQFCQTRNGVFVVMAALKGYKSNQLQQLLDKIIYKSEYLCTDKYSSTMMEYVFKTYGTKVSQKFIQTKIDNIYGKQHYLTILLLDIIINPYGNFIIQKLLHLVSRSQKKILLSKISELIPYLPRKNIRGKWTAIVNDHSKNTVEYVLNAEDRSSNKLYLSNDKPNYSKNTHTISQSHIPKDSDNVNFIHSSVNSQLTRSFDTFDISRNFGVNHQIIYNRDSMANPSIVYFQPSYPHFNSNNFSGQHTHSQLPQMIFLRQPQPSAYQMPYPSINQMYLQRKIYGNRTSNNNS